MSPSTEYENPPNLTNVRVGVLGSMSILSFGTVVTALVDWEAELRLWYMTIVVLGAAFLLIQVWRREYYRRPETVEVDGEGVHLFFQRHEPRFIPWADVEEIFAEARGAALGGGWRRSGMLKTRGIGHYYTLDHGVALALGEERACRAEEGSGEACRDQLPEGFFNG